jgi:MFS family permease
MENTKSTQLSADLNPMPFPCATKPQSSTNPDPCTDAEKKKSWWTYFNMIHLLIPVSRIVYAFPQDFPMNFATPLRDTLGMTDQQL